MSARETAVEALLARVAGLGIELIAQGDKLQCRGPRRLVTRELQAELAARKHEILEHLRRTAVACGDGPLSYAQQRLWFLDQMQPGTAAYNLAMAQHLRGALDAGALDVALVVLMRRHEILRSNFPLVDGAPVQRVMAAPERLLSLVDLRQLPLAEREAEALRLARAESTRPFDLASDRLLRASLYLLDHDWHVFVLCAHHMVADGWSVALIGRELAASYASAAAGSPWPAGEAVAQYASYALWQRQALTDEMLGPDLRYWTAQLAAAPRVLALPTDHPRPPVPSLRGGRVEFQVDAALASTLRSLCEGEGASLFMLLLAASGVLLARYARNNVVSIGTPIAGRNRAEWAPIVGCFVNTLALRVDLAGDPGFGELLGRVRAMALDAFDHQDLPFERLVEALQPERDLSRNPLVQVSVGLHNAPGQAPLATFALPGLQATPLDLDPGSVRFDLELDVWEVAGGLHGRLLFAADLFAASSARRMVAQLQQLLAAIAADPLCPVSRLPLMTAAERGEVTRRWNPTDFRERHDHSLGDLVRAQAVRTPDAVALVCGGEELSYTELLARADEVSRVLRDAGVVSGEPVALCATRGTRAIVGMLGILQSGAAYLPLDPEHPQARLALVLQDSCTRFIVTERQLGERFSDAGLKVVCIDGDPATAKAQPVRKTHRPIEPESLAYVMYTSGSTGRPKGVAVPHRAVASLLDAMDRALPLGPGDVFLAVTTFAFDISVLEIFLPLTRGARLVVADRGETLDAARLAAVIARHGVTAMQATPATWSMLVESHWPGAGAMTGLSGGEALPPSLAAALRERCARVWNVYGPTETTIWSSADEVRANAPVTIGYPLANGALHVLDEHLEPQAVGMAGEIWIGGEGVARGYFGQPGLTARSFLPDPFAARAGARMYRSGDLGRRRDDGRIECLGRIDSQVKFRGFRIEPGDIEATLLTHPGIAKAVVTLIGAPPAEQRLVAHVVANPAQAVDVQELRRHLQDRLPAYLVPGSFVVLDALPTTPNGKIDRAALPAPSQGSAKAAVASPPGNAVERTLAQIWSQVLRVDPVGVEDNFFDLGGHSLLLARVRAGIAQRLGRDVAVLDLFRWPTIRSLARQLEGVADAESGADTAEQAAQQAAAIRRVALAAQAAKVSHG